MRKKLLIVAAILMCIGISSFIIYIISSNSSVKNNKISSVNIKAKLSKKSTPASLTSFQNTLINSSSVVGNTPSNLSKGGLLASDKGYCFTNFSPFFSNKNNVSSIYRSFNDGITSSFKIVPSKDNALYLYLNLHNEWLYFLNYNSNIYKCKTNGNNLEMCLQGSYKAFIIARNYIFYLKSDGSFYRADLDTLDSKQLIDNKVQYFTISEDGKKLFYTKSDYSKIRLYKAAALSSKLSVKEYYSVTAENMISYIYHKNYIYFFPAEASAIHIPHIKSNKILYRLKTSGSHNKIEEFYKNKNGIYDLNIWKSKLYFSDSHHIKYINLHTSRLSSLNMPPVSNFYIAHNKLFGFVISYDYSIETNGRNTSSMYIYDLKENKCKLNTMDSGEIPYYPID
ncbi:DUF5050 domain-containing protein [Clostridium oryzae]|uniref:Prolow-density lipoprotein receptor-related protein 1-like beta-propeller domain-containing protein n=1 Tax=Clostridium oryzae TaxID=1450648 RepID=A0A1V4IN52_9CLOT|nr:DUF5050 domain-containing protein [Clostridium oryzae]OPJ61313.1 hypothetical protein CLORY_23530 [Clostridium oryzae]